MTMHAFPAQTMISRLIAAAFAMLESNAVGQTVSVDDVLHSRIDAYQREIDTYYGLI